MSLRPPKVLDHPTILPLAYQKSFKTPHSHHSTILTFLFYKTIYQKSICVQYILMKVIFKTNLFMWFSHFQGQQLKNYSWFISCAGVCLDWHLVFFLLLQTGRSLVEQLGNEKLNGDGPGLCNHYGFPACVVQPCWCCWGGVGGCAPTKELCQKKCPKNKSH
jgi:hypothetical protein